MAVTVREYETADGRVPFRDWLATLDRATRARSAGAHRSLRDGQPGRPQGRRGRRAGSQGDVRARLPHLLRTGQDGVTLVLLPVRGSKGTQAKDSRRAQQYWRDYLGEK